MGYKNVPNSQKLKNVKVALKNLNKEGFGEIEVHELIASKNLSALQNELHLNPSDEEFFFFFGR